MKALLLLGILAFTMSAQDFRGVTVSGTGGRYTIVNHSTKPLIGYAIQGHTTAGLARIPVRVDFGSVAAGKPMQPGEERHATVLSGGFRRVRLRRDRAVGTVGTATAYEEITANKEEILSYELTAVLFADGTFYGPDSIFSNFSSMISIARSLARDTQYAAQDKYRLLEQDKQAGLQLIMDALRKGAPVRPGTSQDLQKAELRMQMSNVLLGIRDSKGDEEVDAALARLAALPDVVKGE